MLGRGPLKNSKLTLAPAVIAGCLLTADPALADQVIGKENEAPMIGKIEHGQSEIKKEMKAKTVKQVPSSESKLMKEIKPLAVPKRMEKLDMLEFISEIIKWFTLPTEK